MTRFILLLLLGLLPQGTPADGTSPRLREFIRTTWTSADGIPLGSVGNIHQTPDGYLWITTAEMGLLRFDGVRFVSMPSPCGQPVTHFAVAADGGLWLLCDYRLYRRTPTGETHLVPQSLLPPEYRPQANLFVDRQGRLWFWGRSLSYLSPDGGTGHEIPGTVRPPSATNMRFAEDRDGSLWFADNSRLIRVRDDRAEEVLTGRFVALAPARAGGIYALREPDSTLLHVQSGAVTTVMTFQGEVRAASGTVVAESDAGVWIGTRQHGVALVRNGVVELSHSSNENPDGRVQELRVDREGTLWVGTSFGLLRIRAPLAHLMSPAEGVAPGMLSFAFMDSRDDLWTAGPDITVRLDARTGHAHVIPGEYVAIGEDANARIWLATKNDIGYLRGTQFVAVRDDAGAALGGVYAFRRSATGDLWVLAPSSGIYRIVDGLPRRVLVGADYADDFIVSPTLGTWVTLTSGGLLREFEGHSTVFREDPPGVGAGTVGALHADGDAVWIGTDFGLSRWRNGIWTNWTRDHGLPASGRVLDIEADRNGRLLLMTTGGALILPRAQLDATPDGDPRRLSYFRIGSLDRVIPHIGGMRPSPRITVDSKGRMLFVTLDSVAVVDPSTVAESSRLPSIRIESMSADNDPVDLSAPARLVEPGRLQFEYTSLSLRSPENVRFRYRLEPYDRDWIEAGGQRRVTYGTLKPGAYRFRVIGSSGEGVWNEEGAVYAFQVASVFWRTWWFRLALLLIALLAVVTVHRLKLRQAAGQLNLRFEERLAERTRIAQDLHDTLLQGLLASSMQLHVATDAVPDDAPMKPALRRVLQRMTQVVEEGRNAVRGLRSDSSSLDLARTLSAAAQEIVSEPPIEFRVVVEGTARPLHPALRDDVHRIGREAVVNAFRHSRAKHIEVAIEYGPAVFRCLVRDDGRGIEADIIRAGRADHWGLPGMQERAGRIGAELHVRSSAGAGTEVELSMPNHVAFAGERARRRWWPM